MPSLPIAVSISDVLEVRGGPLKESEVWALLCQTAAAIQDFFIKGASSKKDDTIFAISPTSLLIGRDGQVTLSPGDSNWHGNNFMAPEIVSDVSSHILSGTAIEKVFLYTLGKTLQVATEYGLTRSQYVSVSEHLDSLLEAMCEENPSVRIGLRPVLEACDLHIRQHPNRPPYSHTVSRLYASVLGSIDETGHISSGTDSRQSTLTLRSRRRPRHPHFHRHSNTSSRSPSPSGRSRSRSRSHSRGDSRPEEKQENGINGSETHIPPSSSSSPAAAITTTLPPDQSATHPIGPASWQDLDASFASSDQGSVYRSVPAYRSPTPLLSLRMGSPAYEKYLQLKERQRRLKAAKTGEKAELVAGAGQRGGASVQFGPRPPSSVWRGDLMDYMADGRSMASLLSYSLGTYLPELQHLDGLGHVPPAGGHDDDLDLDAGSLLSSDMSFLIHEGHVPPTHQNHHHSNQSSSNQATLPEEQKPAPANTPRKKRQREEDSASHFEHQQQQQQQQESGRHLEQQESQHLQQLQQFGSRDLTPTPDSLPSREFYGPEFVYRASRPVVRISLPLQGESVKNPALARRVIIVHLTGQKFESIVDPCMTGRQLFDAVVTHTGLDDFFFFGLTYICEGEHFFLDADTKLHKMSPEGWREGAKGHMPPVTFTLYLRVKFYPDSLADFRHTSSQHLLYLQLRRDILEERCLATDQHLLALAGLALHAEFGDYSRRVMGHNYFVPEQYLPARVARRLGMGYIHDRALEAHKDALGLAPSQCEVQFIKVVQGLPEYGIHFYKLMRAKNEVNNTVWVGLTQASLLIADQSGPIRTVTRSLPWPSILKISFNKRRFSVQPKVDPGAHIKGKPPKINFFTSSYRKGRYLLQLSTAQHRFHIRMRTRAAALETMAVAGESVYVDTEDQQSETFMPIHHDYHHDVAVEHIEEQEEDEGEGVMVEHAVVPLETSPLHTNKSVTSAETTSDEVDERPEAPPLKYRRCEHFGSRTRSVPTAY